MVTCPECRNEIELDDAKEDEIIECRFCGITLKNAAADLEIVDEGK